MGRAKRKRMTKPCQNGHLGWRYVSTGACCDCVKAKDKARNKGTYPAWVKKRIAHATRLPSFGEAFPEVDS